MTTLKLNSNTLKSPSGNDITHVDSVHIKRGKVVSKNTPMVLQYGKSSSDIARAICVSRDGDLITFASSSLKNTECIGICFSNVLKNGKICYITSGIVSDDSYSFSAPYGRPIWLSAGGIPTDILPSSGYLQKIGISVDATTMLLLIQPKLVRSTTTSNSMEIDYNLLYDISTRKVEYSTKNNNVGAVIQLRQYNQNVPSMVWEAPLPNGTVGHVCVYEESDDGFSSIDDAIITVTTNSILVELQDFMRGIIVYSIL